MNNQDQKREFKGIWIPKEIWLREDLSLIHKILLAEIDSFETANGCFASNSYFGDLLGVSASRISQLVTSLKKKNLISVKLIYKFHSKEVDKRIIKIKKEEVYGIK